MNTIANITSMSNPKLARFMAMWMGCAIVFASINPSFAQSTDRDNPTPLTTKILSNPGKQNKNTVYYYSLTAKPGKITITLDCDAGSVNDAFSTTVRIETLEGKNLQRVHAGCHPGSPDRRTEKIEFPSETPVVLLLSSSGHNQDPLPPLLSSPLRRNPNLSQIFPSPLHQNRSIQIPANKATFGGERHQTM
jgi:hypothetical protein